MHTQLSRLLAVAVSLAALVVHAEPTLREYRWFRALNIDLLGHAPTPEDLTAFEAPGFNADAWVEAHLSGPGYNDRLRRVYMDALRLELGDNVTYFVQDKILHRYAVQVDFGGTVGVKQTYVYYRQTQVRADTARSKGFCLTATETGQTYTNNKPPMGTLKTMPLAQLQQYAVKVKPWWLYSDYKATTPSHRYNAQDPLFAGFPIDPTPPSSNANFNPLTYTGLLYDADKSQANDIWLCKEEASTTETVSMTFSGQRYDVPCETQSGESQVACGCGVGLEKCIPGTTTAHDSTIGVKVPTLSPIGQQDPFKIDVRRGETTWWHLQWQQQVFRLFDSIFDSDGDFREILTAKYGFVNGPITQFYKSIVHTDCCKDQVTGMLPGSPLPQNLFDISGATGLPQPSEGNKWVKVDGGPRAAGVFTSPLFLAKFGTRRAKAHVAWTAFMCREFVAPEAALHASVGPPNPDLTAREGCNSCHTTLEPLAAYFAKVPESGFAWLSLPTTSAACKAVSVTNGVAQLPAGCRIFYDPDFSATTGTLFGAYASQTNADKGPAGLAAEIAGSPEFGACVVKRVTESFLGRQLTADDEPLRASLEQKFVSGGYKLRALVREIVKADAYRTSNNLESSLWRKGSAP